jgi:LysR family glycine cleavage system transcriptional activator
LHGAVKDGLERILEGTRNLNPDDLTGPLVIGCTHTIGSSWAAKHICEFRTKYPTVQIIVKEIQPRQKNIPREIDIAICYGEPESNGRQIKMLASPSLFPVCSPALIQGRTGRVNPKEISSFTLLHDNQVSWDRWFETHNVVKPEVQESIIFPNTSQALTSARLGYGVALGNTFEIQEFVREGQLIQLTDESIEEEQSYFLVSRNEDQMSLKSKIFEEWIVKECLSI